MNNKTVYPFSPGDFTWRIESFACKFLTIFKYTETKKCLRLGEKDRETCGFKSKKTGEYWNNWGFNKVFGRNLQSAFHADFLWDIPWENQQYDVGKIGKTYGYVT